MKEAKERIMNKLTAKEVNFISDLLAYEEQACKKAKLYAKTLTDTNLSEQMCKIAKNHQKRYASLLELL